MLCQFTGKPNLMGVTGGQLPPFSPHHAMLLLPGRACSCHQVRVRIRTAVQEAPRDLHGYAMGTKQDPDGTLRWLGFMDDSPSKNMVKMCELTHPHSFKLHFFWVKSPCFVTMQICSRHSCSMWKRCGQGSTAVSLHPRGLRTLNPETKGEFCEFNSNFMGFNGTLMRFTFMRFDQPLCIHSSTQQRGDTFWLVGRKLSHMLHGAGILTYNFLPFWGKRLARSL